ncbi:acetyltransferase (GNAT) family protein [Clostridium homopropionicum DSM 5847]|uniref:Acetyltransferase (GNAT) family protein n=1 Tax=Clostridium homopropionicum DSM 5847 TaxID=1121318 RepID=A0A0L6Z8D4_9CLOT|nr:GNAT family N-acetyltransferase [Clostridium homopropionicum]KOA19209.1 acetyltransferase (GNAT) family protein [Clostridium homopropionicum DSM 5847]SFG17466.1 Ribosomal protein S18 acetylase RimI [Clostridium homopropionicum]
MKIIEATLKDFNTVHEIVHTTITKIYPLYYPIDVVQFFLNHHSIDNIKNALAVEYILLIELQGRIIGTGSIFKNEIKRMFILPEFQGRGYGSVLLKELEHNAENEGYDTIILDASLPGYSLYEKRGYTSVKYNKVVTPKGHVLCYNQMLKAVKNSNFLIDYNNRIFTSISNSDNGEVSNKTIFKYNQQDNIIWAEYFGGEIVKGYLIGTSDIDGKLDFCYQHINTGKQIRTGKCNSTPEILNDGRIKLFEEWEWTNGDISKGSSIIEEI